MDKYNPLYGTILGPPSLCISCCRDLLRIGVTLAGHQKKILSNIQTMRVQMSQSPTPMA